MDEKLQLIIYSFLFFMDLLLLIKSFTIFFEKAK